MAGMVRRDHQNGECACAANGETGMADQMRYQVVEGWEQLPKGFAHRDVAGVAVDQEDRVFLICRGENPVIVYDREGNFLRTWGKGDFSMQIGRASCRERV